MNIRNLIKKNGLLSSFGYLARQEFYHYMMSNYKDRPIDNNKVLFYRSGGAYGDNPKAIAEYLHLYYPYLTIVWAYSDDSALSTLPEYIVPVKHESKDFFYHMCTSIAWVCSDLLPLGTIKKENQLYIQTWHGDKGFKKIAYDATDLKSYRKRTANRQFAENDICDYFLTGSKWFIPKIRSAIGYYGTILDHGLPRNDCLVNYDSDHANIIKNSLGIPEDNKVLIYAPTFRDHKDSYEHIDSDIDLKAIINALEKNTGESWICLLKAHSGSKLVFDHDSPTLSFLDVTSYPDIADLLMISDMLITDYSSCAGDFAITNHFILIYQDDYDLYITKDRSLYFDMQDSPYFVAHNTSEAIGLINKVNEEDIKQNCESIRNFYGVCETGKVSEEVASIINKHRNLLG